MTLAEYTKSIELLTSRILGLVKGAESTMPADDRSAASLALTSAGLILGLPRLRQLRQASYYNYELLDDSLPTPANNVIIREGEQWDVWGAALKYKSSHKSWSDAFGYWHENESYPERFVTPHHTMPVSDMMRKIYKDAYPQPTRTINVGSTLHIVDGANVFYGSDRKEWRHKINSARGTYGPVVIVCPHHIFVKITGFSATPGDARLQLDEVKMKLLYEMLAPLHGWTEKSVQYNFVVQFVDVEFAYCYNDPNDGDQAYTQAYSQSIRAFPCHRLMTRDSGLNRTKSRLDPNPNQERSQSICRVIENDGVHPPEEHLLCEWDDSIVWRLALSAPRGDRSAETVTTDLKRHKIQDLRSIHAEMDKLKGQIRVRLFELVWMNKYSGVRIDDGYSTTYA